MIVKIKKIVREVGIMSLSLTVAFVAFVGFSIANGWTAPPSDAPGGNLGAPINTSSIGQSKIGGIILNTGGAAIGLIVDKGNVGIGTQTPNPARGADGNVDVNDVYLRGVGMWASEISAGGNATGIDINTNTNPCTGGAGCSSSATNGDDLYSDVTQVRTTASGGGFACLASLHNDTCDGNIYGRDWINCGVSDIRACDQYWNEFSNGTHHCWKQTITCRKATIPVVGP